MTDVMPALLRVADVARIWGMSEAAVRASVRRGTFAVPPLDRAPGGRIVWSVVDVSQYIGTEPDQWRAGPSG